MRSHTPTCQVKPSCSDVVRLLRARGSSYALRSMGIIVQKFGGTSVGDAERIRRVARRVADTVGAGHQAVVVASAMGDTTDELRKLSSQISTNPPPRELDMLLSAGERISMALLAMAIHELGHDAESFTGSQAGIITDALHTRARIADIRPRRIIESLAAALGAELCEIYTDVDGVLTADPRIVPNARKLHAVSYEEMLEMAATGARVLMTRSVEMARNHGVVVHVRSSFTAEDGTFIREEDERMMEKAIISAVTHDSSEAKGTLQGVPDRPGVAAKVFRPLADHGVNVDMIVQNVSHDGRTDISFTVPREDLAEAMRTMKEVASDIGAAECVGDDDVARVSLVGAGMKAHPGVSADMFEVLADAGVNIEMISTSAIRISIIIRRSDVQTAVRAIHERFKLSEEVVLRAEHPEAE